MPTHTGDIHSKIVSQVRVFFSEMTQTLLKCSSYLLRCWSKHLPHSSNSTARSSLESHALGIHIKTETPSLWLKLRHYGWNSFIMAETPSLWLKLLHYGWNSFIMAEILALRLKLLHYGWKPFIISESDRFIYKKRITYWVFIVPYAPVKLCSAMFVRNVCKIFNLIPW